MATPKTEKSWKIILDELQERAEKLAALLKAREIGLQSWNYMLVKDLKEFRDFLCLIFSAKKGK